MKNSLLHNTLITSGCLLWCISFFAEVQNFRPYSLAGMIASPIIIITGIAFWLRYYKTARGKYPDSKNVPDNVNRNGGRFTLGAEFLLTHLAEFFTACFLLCMAGIWFMILTTRFTEPFYAAQRFCETNSEIQNTTGAIKYYGMLAGEERSKKNENELILSFSIKTEQGNFDVKTTLVMECETWGLASFELK